MEKDIMSKEVKDYKEDGSGTAAGKANDAGAAETAEGAGSAEKAEAAKSAKSAKAAEAAEAAKSAEAARASKSAKDARGSNYVKVFVLYLLWNIDAPLEFETVNDIVTADGYVGYFDFAECFAELLDGGHVEKLTGESGEELYRITQKGINVAENLSDDIFAEIRDRSLKSALRLISFKERHAELRYECVDVPDSEGGGYSVTCSVLEHGRATCSVTVKVDSKNRADAIRKNFHEHPEAIYRGALSLLQGDLGFLL